MPVLCDCVNTTTVFLLVITERDQNTQFILDSIGRLTVLQEQLSPACRFFCLFPLKDGLGIYTLPTFWQVRAAVLFYHFLVKSVC